MLKNLKQSMIVQRAGHYLFLSVFVAITLIALVLVVDTIVSTYNEDFGVEKEPEVKPAVTQEQFEKSLEYLEKQAEEHYQKMEKMKDKQ